MKNEKPAEGYDGYLPPQEQLIIGAKVNRLCVATPDTFDAETQVADAQDIINALSSRIKPRGKFKVDLSLTSSSSSEIKAGATNAGSINMRFDETKRRQWQFGVSEYRIGNYVGVQQLKRRVAYIYFEHFWDRGENNEAFERESNLMELSFNPTTLEIQQIAIAIPTTRHVPGFYFTTYRNLPLWTKNK